MIFKQILIGSLLVLCLGCSNPKVDSFPIYSIGDAVLGESFGEPGIVVGSTYKHFEGNNYVPGLWSYEILLSNGKTIIIGENKIKGVFKVSPWKNPYNEKQVPTLAPPPPPPAIHFFAPAILRMENC